MALEVVEIKVPDQSVFGHKRLRDIESVHDINLPLYFRGEVGGFVLCHGSHDAAADNGSEKGTGLLHRDTIVYALVGDRWMAMNILAVMQVEFMKVCEVQGVEIIFEQRMLPLLYLSDPLFISPSSSGGIAMNSDIDGMNPGTESPENPFNQTSAERNRKMTRHVILVT